MFAVPEKIELTIPETIFALLILITPLGICGAATYIIFGNIVIGIVAGIVLEAAFIISLLMGLYTVKMG